MKEYRQPIEELKPLAPKNGSIKMAYAINKENLTIDEVVNILDTVKSPSNHLVLSGSIAFEIEHKGHPFRVDLHASGSVSLAYIGDNIDHRDSVRHIENYRNLSDEIRRLANAMVKVIESKIGNANYLIKMLEKLEEHELAEKKIPKARIRGDESEHSSDQSYYLRINPGLASVGAIYATVYVEYCRGKQKFRLTDHEKRGRVSGRSGWVLPGTMLERLGEIDWIRNLLARPDFAF